MKERRKTWVSTAGDDGHYYPEDTIKKYCLKCESFGFPYQELGERIYSAEQLINGQPPHDADLWRQCYRCGALVPVQHGKQEGRITGFVQVPGFGDSLEPLAEHFINPRKKKDTKKNARQSAIGAIEEDQDVKRLTSGSGSELRGYTDSSS